ncbi:hypothetical protein CPB86DRAFT_871713 [Serendipita vermifera]|nr:hypothetical protein CPB86DRAFT_871713 [Serendipita vermifera]
MLLLNSRRQNLWQRSDSQQQIYDNLNAITRQVSNQQLCQLLYRKVEALCTSKTRTDEVARIIHEIREKVGELGPIKLNDPTSLEHQDKVAPILSKGCTDLNDLKSFRQKRPQLQKEIDNAIGIDRSRLESTVKRQPKQTSPTQQTIRVFFMDEPERKPQVIDEKYSKFKEIRWYLMTKRIIGVSDMWIRYENKHQLTPHGRCWEYINPKEDIDPTTSTLEIDIVDIKSRGEYIVALLHENNQEFPTPLDIAKGGGRCCDPNCGDLRNHLDNLWQTRSVIKALRLSNPENSADVFSSPLNDETFDHRTNDLYLKCEPREEQQMCHKS